MRIGFDGKRAVQNFTGLGNYSRYVMDILARYYPENQYLLYSAKKPSQELLKSEFNTSGIKFRYPDHTFFSSFWRSRGIIRDLKKDKIELYHGLSYELPVGIQKTGIASVVTIHDLIFLRYPQYYTTPDRIIYHLKTRYACKQADKIIAISEQTKRDIICFYDIPEYKIDVIYQNCAPVFNQQVSEQDKERVRLLYQLPQRYVLSVGTIEARKNLLLIAKSLKNIPEEISLVVIGKETTYTQKVIDYLRKNGLQQRVLFLKNIPFHDLPAIYRQAEIFIYPSEFEGFGIPIIEALHSGIPVIAAKGSCLEEAGGPGGVYIDPKDDQELANQVNDILQNPGKRKQMIEDGYLHLNQFRDEVIAQQIMSLYQKTLKHV